MARYYFTIFYYGIILLDLPNVSVFVIYNILNLLIYNEVANHLANPMALSRVEGEWGSCDQDITGGKDAAI